MKRTLIFALAALLVVGGTAAGKFLPRALSYDECSPVYRHFADMELEGVRVTYIKDKIINDTLRLPATLLEAESDRGWELLDSLFGYTETQMIFLNDPDIPDVVKKSFLEDRPDFQIYRAHPETPERKIEKGSTRSDDVVIYIFPFQQRVCIFEVRNGETFGSEHEAAMKELKEEELCRRSKAIWKSVMIDLDLIPE
jgi:hypothetical protein